MDELVAQSKVIIEHLDNGDLMSCYSVFEANIRNMLDDLDQDTKLVQLWQTQRGYVDDEDWASVMENIENIRAVVNA